MTVFERVCAFVVDQLEAGFVDDPRDPGGVTNHGISLRFALDVGDLDGDGRPDLDIDEDGDIDSDDIRSMPRDLALRIYERIFWIPLRCPQLPPPLAAMMFDTGINMGRGPAITLLQAAVNVTQDGRFGPLTLAAIDRMSTEDLLAWYLTHRSLRYMTLAKFPTYGRGWLRRTYLIHRHALGLRGVA